MMKTQNNATTNAPATGQFTSGALTFSTGDMFVFQLNYGNASTGAINNVTVVDSFPTGFTLTASSVTSGMLCNPNL